MDDNTVRLIGGIAMLIVFFGWIPIFAIGKVISWIILVLKDENEDESLIL